MIRVKDAELQKLRSQTKNLQNSLERTTEVNIIIVNIEDYIVIFSCDVAAIRFKVQQVKDKGDLSHGWPNKILQIVICCFSAKHISLSSKRKD